ncbi:ABC transporter permease, nitrate/sulfonate/bicarbonate transport [Streptococcus pneumoniae]|nr:ABC transporter permease, nitrate/sulfonate/bicarbonate transport [Streptococcus pneumoniae]
MRNLRSILRRHISLLGFLGVLSIWQLAGFLKLLPKFILPTPLEILQPFVRDREFLWHHSWATLRVALLGLILGVLIACLMAVLMDSLTWLNDLIYPMMVVIQTIPTIANSSYPGLVARLWDFAQDCLDYLNDNLSHHRQHFGRF